MDRDTYTRWNDHPVRSVLRSAAQVDARYLPTRTQLVEELTDNGVPTEMHPGLLKAAEAVAAKATGGGMTARHDAQRLADETSLEIVNRLTRDDSLLGDGTRTTL
jgi:hypothetical protein